MSKLNIPSLKRVPEGATKETRIQMFEDYKSELMRMNPGRFNNDGSIRTIWQAIKELVARHS